MSRHAPKRTEMHPNAPESTWMHPNAVRDSISRDNPRSECTQMHPGAPECTLNSQSGKTNPPTLSFAQHAATRYLARGYRVGQIARHLGVSRHTIKRWKHDAQFIAELERLRHEMTAAIISPAARATPPPRPLDPLAAYLRTQACAVEPADGSADDSDDGDDIDNPDADDLDLDADEQISDEEFAETEAWVEQIIRAARAGEEIPPPPPLKKDL